MTQKLTLSFLLALLLGALPFFGASPAAAAETDVGFAFYEKQAKEVLKSAAAKVWECADDAKKQGFHEYAEQQAERALEFDPDNADAREHLKYERKEGKWVQDKEAFDKMGHQNVHNSAESQAGFDKRLKKWQEETLPKANKYVAAKYAELGDICVAKGHVDQSTKAYEASLGLDKENEKARKGLGYTKFGKVWLTKKQDEARKAASKATVVTEKEPTVWEDLFKVKLNKVESAHIRIESTFPVDELMEHCKGAETAYAYYLADFGKDPGEDVFDGQKSIFIIMGTEEQWNLFIDRYGGSDKEFTRQLTGCGFGELCRGIRGARPDSKVDKGGGKSEVTYGSSPDSRRDQLVHGLIHQMNERVWRLGSRAWLDEGLTYYYTLKALETCLTHCVALHKGDYANGHQDEGGLKKWDDPANWKPMLKKMVQKKDDLPLRSLIMLPIAKLDLQATIKAWAMATWMMDLDRPKFIRIIDQLMDPALKQENILQGEYGKGLEEIDDDWHKIALKTY